MFFVDILIVLNLDDAFAVANVLRPSARSVSDADGRQSQLHRMQGYVALATIYEIELCSISY
jgi:hypothetical protein